MKDYGDIIMNFWPSVNRWWYMILELIKESASLQALLWGVIIVFIIKSLPPLIKELKSKG